MSGSDNVVPCGSSGEELVEDKTSKVMKSEEYPWMMLEQLNKQRMSNLYCDFTICIDDEEYPVHQGILAAKSEYFNAMFTSKLKEGFEKRVEIKESSKQCIERILGFLYSGKIELSVENIEETIRCAALMQIPDLLQVASEYVHSLFNAGNCIHFRGLAKFLYMDDLVKKADKYLLDHFRDVCRDESWNELSAEDVEMFISSEDVVVESEEVVYECMVGWVKHHLQSRKQYFPTLFKHIRLTNLCLNYIEQVIRKEDLLYEFRVCCEAVHKHYFDNIGSTPTNNPRKGDFTGTLAINTIPSPTPLNNSQVEDDKEYMEKLKQLQKYIEPLSRMISKFNKYEEKYNNDLCKMKTLRDTLMNPNKRLLMSTLDKCEKVLQNWLDQKPSQVG
ncbi:kelch-like protein 2 [Ciona intestinalis]